VKERRGETRITVTGERPSAPMVAHGYTREPAYTSGSGGYYPQPRYQTYFNGYQPAPGGWTNSGGGWWRN
jgi:hypothetical protein